MRCPAEMVQYHIAQLGRRMYGRYGMPSEENLASRVKEIEEGKFDKEFEELLGLSMEELEPRYQEQQETREVY